MLTIKIVYDGSETIKEVESVALRSSLDVSPSVTFTEKGNAGFVSIWEGDIYVMNDNGKTIADYHLGHRMPEEPNVTAGKNN